MIYTNVKHAIPTNHPATASLIIVEKDAEDERDVYALCTPTERKLYANVSMTKQRDWLFGRLAAKRALQKHFNRTEGTEIPLNEFEITSGQGVPPHGAMVDALVPFDTTQVLLSISHSYEYAVANVVSGPTYQGIGVDIERVHTFKEGVLKSFLTEEEFKSCQTLSPSLQKIDSTLRWSLKEAYLKAIGTGIKTHPRKVETHIDYTRGTITLSVEGKQIPATIFWTVYQNIYMLVNVVL